VALSTSGLSKTTLATLNLPAGSFAIFARAGFTPVGVSNFFASCTLTAGADSDSLDLGAENGDPFDVQETSLNVLHTFASPGSATLSCSTTINQAAKAGDARITAIQVSNIS
jgi:hypothetical protein